MQMKKALVTFGAAMAVSQGASALTIINTDSAVATGGAETRQVAPGNVQVARTQPATAAALSSPPLPGGGVAAASPTPREAPSSEPPRQAATAAPSRSNDLSWVDSNGRSLEDSSPPEQLRSPSGEVASTGEQPGNVQPPESQTRISVASVQDAAPASANTSSQTMAARELSYLIEEGWLSDAMERLADRSNYQLMWEVGEHGRADFRIHRDFSLSATTAREVLEQVIQPYPIRLCLFQVDRVAKVVPAGRSCQ